MITHKTFWKGHIFWLTTASIVDKQERLRREAAAFIADRLKAEDVVSVSETSSLYLSTVTVWYQGQ